MFMFLGIDKRLTDLSKFLSQVDKDLKNNLNDELENLDCK